MKYPCRRESQGGAARTSPSQVRHGPALGRMVTEAVAANPEQKVTVRGDRGSAYAHIVRVLDICKAAGIQEPYLDTVLPE